MSHLNYPMMENLKSLKNWPKDAQRHGARPFLLPCCCTHQQGWLHYQPKQCTVIHGKSLKITHTCPFFEHWFPKQMGSHWPRHFWKEKIQPPTSFPQNHAKPRGNFPPSTLKAKHLSKAARVATRPAGPVIDLPTVDPLIRKERNKRDRWNAVGFWGWTLVTKTCHPYGTGMGIFT